MLLNAIAVQDCFTSRPCATPSTYCFVAASLLATGLARFVNLNDPALTSAPNVPRRSENVHVRPRSALAGVTALAANFAVVTLPSLIFAVSTASVANFAAVTEASANFAVVTFRSTMAAVSTASSANFAAVTEPSANFAVVTLASRILTVVTLSEANFAAVTLASANFAVVTALSMRLPVAMVAEAMSEPLTNVRAMRGAP